MRAIGNGLPITHGIEAAREVVSGRTLGSVSGLMWAEAAVGVVYAAAAYGLFRFFEAQSRRCASLDSM
jgi:ABC-2 type transport system permease protein